MTCARVDLGVGIACGGKDVRHGVGQVIAEGFGTALGGHAQTGDVSLAMVGMGRGETADATAHGGLEDELL